MRDGRSDFDFLVGCWSITHRVLKLRLQGCTDWETFEGSSVGRSILGGAGNQDEVVWDTPVGPRSGLTVRLYEPVTDQWRLYWADDRHGELFVPMVGRFDNGRGTFYAHEPNNCEMVLSRFIWSGITANSAHWEQALSNEAAPHGRRTGQWRLPA